MHSGLFTALASHCVKPIGAPARWQEGERKIRKNWRDGGGLVAWIPPCEVLWAPPQRPLLLLGALSEF